MLGSIYPEINRLGKSMKRLLSGLSVAAVAFIMGGLLFSLGCAREKEVEQEEDVLLKFDDKVLTMREVIEKIPVGIAPADSAVLFTKIVESWIESGVLSDLAETKLPDLEEIERKVNEYRSRLITTEYLKRMKEGQPHKISQDSVRAYYEAHRGELLTESPLIKGVYIKVSSSTAGIEEMKALISRADDEAIDLLEKEWVGEALQYDYFGSTWIDWQTLADQIPYRFYDPDAFLESTKNFETTYNGSTYLFHINEYLPTGSEQPYEFASGKISAILEQTKMADYEKALVESLVKKAIKEKRLVTVNYDPMKKVMVRKASEVKNKENIK